MKSKLVSMVLVTVFAAACLAQSYRCDWAVNGIAGGEISSSAYKSGSTAGQTAVGLSTASGFTVLAGFWLPDYGVGIQEPGEVRADAAAAVTRLEAVVPNPMRSSAVLRYSLGKAEPVSLVVCDLTGRVVRSLTQALQTAGVYRLLWDGRDKTGRLLPPGVYLVRFAAGDHRATQKLVLQR